MARLGDDLRPARTVRPGAILRKELEARGWTQADLARILGRPEQVVSEIITGRKQITPETAVGLGAALGTSPQFWLNLEANYRLRLADRDEKREAVRRRSRIYSVVPVRELIRRGWIEEPGTDQELEARVLEFLGVPSLDELPPLKLAARRTPTREPDARALLAWIRRLERLAADQTVPPYRVERLEAAVEDLLTLTVEARCIVEIPRVLREAGVRFVIVSHLPGTYLDGAVYAGDENPIVALTLRHDRLDSFWFTLLHEIAHVILGHQGERLEDLDLDAGSDPEEREADRWAADRLIPREEFERLAAEVRPYFSRQAIRRFAARIRRHPAIVIGRLQHDRVVSQAHLRASIPKVRRLLAPWVDVAEPAYPTEAAAAATVGEPAISEDPAGAILEWLHSHPGWHAPAEIKQTLGLTRSAWSIAIRHITTAGLVERAGEKRGTRYRSRSGNRE